MDPIRHAIELSRGPNRPAASRVESGAEGGPVDSEMRRIVLDAAHLESTRIVAHGGGDPQGRSYDMLRTQVLQEMDDNGWQFLAVTSATPGCGKSVTSCNLAMGIARLSERSVLLVDLDLMKPRVREYLGLPGANGVLSVLDGRAKLSNVMVQAAFGPTKMLVVPGEVCKSGSSEWMASQNMSGLLRTLKREFKSSIVIFDMPPMLLGDDVITILPQMDAVLLVAGVGNTSIADIRQCHKHLQTTPVVRVVVNRVSEAIDSYYGYGYYGYGNS
jgi:protein-tyrosine kinase